MRAQVFAGLALGCSLSLRAQTDTAAPPSSPKPQPSASTKPVAGSLPNTASPKQIRAAEDAYFAGAKRLEHDDLEGAERNFRRALELDPGNRDYALAISIARQHHVTELVRKSTQARLAGNIALAETLLAQARVIDPENPVVLEHTPPLVESAQARRSASANEPRIELTDRSRILNSAGDAFDPFNDQPLRIRTPALTRPIELQPTAQSISFHIRGSAEDLLRQVATAYGIRAVFDEVLDPQPVRFDLDAQPYERSMGILMGMANVFAVPLDEHSILIARDTGANRARLERYLEETIFLPGVSQERMKEVTDLMHGIFGVTQSNTSLGLGNIVVRMPATNIGAMNRTVADLVDTPAEIMLEVKMYEIDTSRMQNVGANIPTAIGGYNVASEANNLVNQNQTIVQQAIAQGLIPSTASNLQIALALLASGLVTSSALQNTLGFFGNGLTLTGVNTTGSTAFNLALNSSDTRSLDDIQLQIGEHEQATVMVGTRYPIITSTYTTGLSTPPSSLSNANINGVNVANLLSQFAGGSAATIPNIQYENLGITIKTTPVILGDGGVHLKLEMKVEALGGTSLNNIPLLVNREFNSELTVARGQSAILATFMNRNETGAVTGEPGLSELPGFEVPLNQNTERDTMQLVVSITPRIIRPRNRPSAGPRMVVQHIQPGSAAGGIVPPLDQFREQQRLQQEQQQLQQQLQERNQQLRQSGFPAPPDAGAQPNSAPANPAVPNPAFPTMGAPNPGAAPVNPNAAPAQQQQPNP